jgi:hypothetical protein
MDGKHQSPPLPQISKSRRIKGFGEDIGQLSLGVYVSHLNVSLLYMISQEMMSSLNMSHLFVLGWIFGYRDDTGVIAQEGNSLKSHFKVSWCALSKECTSNSYILGLDGGLCNRRLLLRRPANKRRSKKMTSIRSDLSVNLITHKISIEKAN